MLELTGTVGADDIPAGALVMLDGSGHLVRYRDTLINQGCRCGRAANLLKANSIVRLDATNNTGWRVI